MGDRDSPEGGYMAETAYTEFEIRGDECLRGLSRAFGCRPGMSEEDSLTVGAMVTCIIPVTGGNNGLAGVGVFAYPHMSPKELEEHAVRLAGSLGYRLTGVRSGKAELSSIPSLSSQVLRNSERLGKVGVPYLSRAYMTVQAGDVPVLFLQGTELGTRARSGLSERVGRYVRSVVESSLPEKEKTPDTGSRAENAKAQEIPVAMILVPHETGGRER